MSYRIAMSVKTDHPADALAVFFERVVWPENQDGLDVPSGYMNEQAPRLDGRIRVWRELGDDLSVIEDNADLSDLSLAEALVRQWEVELKPFLPELAQAGIGIVKTDVEPSEALDKASRAWVNGRAERAAKLVSEERQAKHKADDLAYARVVARRGYPAERGWAPDLVDEYEAEAKRGLEERVARIRCGDNKLLLTTLRETIQYAEAVLGEPATGRVS